MALKVAMFIWGIHLTVFLKLIYAKLGGSAMFCYIPSPKRNSAKGWGKTGEAAYIAKPFKTLHN